MQAADYTVESVDNALRLILMLQSQGVVRLKDAASELGLAHATAHRLLNTLRQRGFAIQDEKRRYLPGPALRLPAQGSRSSGGLRSVARHHLEELTRQFEESTHLMVRVGTSVRFLDSVECTQALRIGSRIGVVSPAHLSSGGKSLLASLSSAEVKSLYVDSLDEQAVAELLRKLETVRRRGYALNLNESERGISAVGVCLRSADGRAIGAISISAPSIRLPRGRLPIVAGELRERARLVEQDLARAGDAAVSTG